MSSKQPSGISPLWVFGHLMHNSNYRQTGVHNGGQLKPKQPLHGRPAECERVLAGWAKKSQKALKQMRNEMHLPTPRKLFPENTAHHLLCFGACLNLVMPFFYLHTIPPVKLSQTRLGFQWQPHLQYCWWPDWGNEYTGNYFLKDK